MTDTLRQAAQQALEALEKHQWMLIRHDYRSDEYICIECDNDQSQGHLPKCALSTTITAIKKALRTALEQQAEPVALTKYRCSVCAEFQFQTPSGMVCRNGHGGVEGIMEVLYD